MLEKSIVALDNMGRDQALDFVKSYPSIEFYKIGMELFYAHGKKFVLEVTNQDKKIFLDLKLHDIPNTVASAIKSLEGLNVEFLTIHIAGGSEMLKRAKQARDQYLPNCKLLGVTYLTSLDQNDAKELFGHETLQINKLVDVAQNVEIDGIICSAQDISLISKNTLLKVCPGIRFEQDIQAESHDQKRVMTPNLAIESGADFLVLGRTITQAKDVELRLQSLS